MCGRYLLTTPVDALAQLFRFGERRNLGTRYNIAPTRDVLRGLEPDAAPRA
jgi:putative SOS response-associated peptidase YedK